MTTIQLSPPDGFEVEIGAGGLNEGRWVIWLRRFDNYLLGSGVKETETARKVALLLHIGGPQLEEIYTTNGGKRDSDTYAGACKIGAPAYLSR